MKADHGKCGLSFEYLEEVFVEHCNHIYTYMNTSMARGVKS